MAVDILWRVLKGWPANYKQTPGWQQRRAPFKARWEKTLDELDLELRNIYATDVVIEVDMDERQIAKSTGRPRADAVFRTPGVVLQFERDGELYIFPCDTFSDWQDNVRAIALTLNALRTMERYGTTSGRQYQGFKNLPSQGSTTMTTERAMTVLRKYYSNGTNDWMTLLRIARAKSHPDSGGSHDAFVEVQHAEKTLRAAGVIT